MRAIQIIKKIIYKIKNKQKISKLRYSEYDKYLKRKDFLDIVEEDNKVELSNTVIPEGKTVVEYMEFAAEESIIDLKIPDSVKVIDLSAFSYCTKLKNVTLPNGILYIGPEAFNLCESLKRITLPLGLKYIGISAFNGCQSLESIVIPGSIKDIEDRTFFDCSNLKNVTISSGIINIGELAFGKCVSITDIVIPDSVVNIGKKAFAGCSSLTNVIISNSVKKIAEDAFKECPCLESITVLPGNKKYHSAGNCIIETAKKELIKGCNGSIIPSDGSVKIIGKNAFYYLERIKNIAIPYGITSIGEISFAYCKDFVNVTIPESVKNIGKCAFCRCDKLTHIVIPKKVSLIEKDAFLGIESVAVSSKNNKYRISDGCLIDTVKKILIHGCDKCEIHIDDNVEIIEDKAFYYCVFLERIVVPKSIKKINNDAFFGCFNLKNIYYNGTREMWNDITEQYNNLFANKCTVHCIDGKMIYNIQNSFIKRILQNIWLDKKNEKESHYYD